MGITNTSPDRKDAHHDVTEKRAQVPYHDLAKPIDIGKGKFLNSTGMVSIVENAGKPKTATELVGSKASSHMTKDQYNASPGDNKKHPDEDKQSGMSMMKGLAKKVIKSTMEMRRKEMEKGHKEKMKDMK